MGTNIIWTDETWNVSGGCVPVSAGCVHCAAARSAQRCVGFGNAKYNGLVDKGRWTGEVRLYPGELEKPLHWKQPRRIFVDFMSDLFFGTEADRICCEKHNVPFNPVPFEFIDKVIDVIENCPQHTFQILTKRHERMFEYFNGLGKHFLLSCLPNLWFGVTAENQEMADKRIPILLQIPAAVRFVSIEPMLGVVDLHHIKDKTVANTQITFNSLSRKGGISYKDGIGLDWVILGGESGPGARPMHPDWARSVRDQCEAAGVPFLFKQWGAWVPKDHFVNCNWEQSRTSCLPRTIVFEHGMKFFNVGKKKAGRLLDGKEHNGYPKR